MKPKLNFIPGFLVKRCPRSGRIVKFRFDNIYAKIAFPIVGILAIMWFLFRVLPKPSRAAYPCQQVAAGIGGSFLFYVISIVSSLTLYQKIRKRTNKSAVLMVIAGSALVLSVTLVIAEAQKPVNPEDSFVMVSTNPEGPNKPMGVGKGIFPGRVVWVRDTDATNWDGSEKSWWDDKHTDQGVVSQMFSKMLKIYTGKTDDKASWDAIFKYYNRTHDRGDIGYKPGEKITIKINANHDKKTYEWDNEAHPSPAAIYALVSQLIDVVGVSGEDITIAEPSQLIGNPIYHKIRSNPGAEYQKVWFADKKINDDPQRIYAEPDMNSSIYFTMLDTTTKTFTKKIKFNLPKCYTEATYLINMAILRGHRVFGVTMNSKNHFGSLYSPELGRYAPGQSGTMWRNNSPQNLMLHSFSLWDYSISNKLGQPSFSPFILGDKDLGGKELLYLMDGIITSKRNEGGMIKYTTLDNDWCSSLFISQDPVAIQSVGTDIMCNESNVTNNNPSFVVHLDNFLQESALAGNPPSGFQYDPENDGKYIQESLGVHEHWNNPKEKKYSRNLGKDEGIELIYTGL
jgi:hypothetical protein